MRMRQLLQILIEIENYSSSIDTQWYIKNITIEILGRPTWTTSKIVDLDPVSPRRLGRIRTSILSDDYTVMKLHSIDNDSYTMVNRHMVRLSHYGFDVGDDNLLCIQLNYQYNGSPVIGNSHWIIYQEANRIEFIIDIYAYSTEPVNYSLDYAGIYSNNARISPEWLTTAQNILMALGIVSAFISLGSSPWITLGARTPSAILSYPGFLVYSDSFSSITCRYINDERGETHIRCSVTYSPSFGDASFQLRLILSKPGYPWRNGDVVKVAYTVKTYVTYEAYGNGIYLVRRSCIYENNTAYLEPYTTK